MKKESFVRESDEHLIIMDCKIDFHKIFLALDTGASHTTVDLAALQIAGYSISDAIREVPIETASGVINGYMFKVQKIRAMDTVIENMEICAYDFFANHLLTDFDGVLGLDFFIGKKLCIDFNENVVTMQ